MHAMVASVRQTPLQPGARATRIRPLQRSLQHFRSGRARGVWAVRAIIAGVVAWGFYAAAVRPNLLPVRFAEVEADRFYRSAADDRPSAAERAMLRHGIRTVVDLVEPEADPIRERLAQRTADAVGVRRLVFPVGDSANPNPNAFVAALRVLSEPEFQPVLVRCPNGRTRTDLCADLYRVVNDGSGLDPQRSGALSIPWADDVLRALDEGGWVPGFPNYEEELARARATPAPARTPRASIAHEGAAG